MDQFKTCIIVISLEGVSEGVLIDARTIFYALILSLSSLTRVTLKTSSRCCIFFFFTFCLNEKITIFTYILSIFLPIYLLSVHSKAQYNILWLKSPLVAQESPGTVSPPWVRPAHVLPFSTNQSYLCNIYKTVSICLLLYPCRNQNHTFLLF